jgi:F1F0 ATPase subunit 2
MSVLQLVFSFVGGVAAGALYFSGLWYTVRQLPTTQRPVLLLIGSFTLRLALLLGAIFLFTRTHWSYVVTAVFGLLLARTLLIRHWGPTH